MEVLLFIDTTNIEEYYFKYVLDVEKYLLNKKLIIRYFEWNSKCRQIGKKTFRNLNNNIKSECLASKPSSIIPFLERNAHEHLHSVIIISNSSVNQNEANKTFLEFSSAEKMPKLDLTMINNDEDFSVILPFTKNGNCAIIAKNVNNAKCSIENLALLERFDRSIIGIKKFCEQINIGKMIIDKNYKNEIQIQLRAMTYMSLHDQVYKNTAKLEIEKLSKSCTVECVSELILANKNANDIIKHIEKNSEHRNLYESIILELKTIVENCDDFKRLKFDWNFERKFDWNDSTDSTDSTDRNNTPFIIYNKNIRFMDLNSKYLKEIHRNPLLMLDYCKNELNVMFDPEFSDSILNRDVLTFGTSNEKIEKTNSTLLQFFDCSSIDCDFILMSIWYHLKYVVKQTNELKSIEDQLKARFLKMTVLDKYLNRCPKFCLLWYMIHELPFVKQHDQSRSAILIYLSKINVLASFLKDIFDVIISEQVKEYLLSYYHMHELSEYKDSIDELEFWRVIISLKNDFIQVDRSNMYTLPKKITTLKYDHTAIKKKITIPIDISPGKINIDYSKLLQMFPKSIQKLSTNCIIYFALIIYNKKEFFFDEEKNQEIIKNSIKRLGYDPLQSKLDWSLNSNNRFNPAIDPKTLRPYKLVNNVTWHENARKLIGSNECFISYYNNIAKFVAENGKIPTADEFIIFIYKQEISSEKRICFRSKFKKDGCKSEYYEKIKKSINKLPSSIVQNVTDVIENFSNAASYLSMEAIFKRLEN